MTGFEVTLHVRTVDACTARDLGDEVRAAIAAARERSAAAAAVVVDRVSVAWRPSLVDEHELAERARVERRERRERARGGQA